MEGQRVVVTYAASSDEKALFQEILGNEAPLEFLEGLAPEQRPALLRTATVLLVSNSFREIPPRQVIARLGLSFLLYLQHAGAQPDVNI